jgi:hypothetical protein
MKEKVDASIILVKWFSSIFQKKQQIKHIQRIIGKDRAKKISA